MNGLVSMGNYGIGKLQVFMRLGTLLQSSVGMSYRVSRLKGRY